MSRSEPFLAALLLLSGAVWAEEGDKVFAARCAVCHGPEAAGVPGTFPALREQVVAFARTEEGRDYLIMVVSSGLMGGLKLSGVSYNNVMPAQAGMSEEDIAAVLSFLGKSSISAEAVKAARARHADNAASKTRSLRPAYEP